MTCPANFTGSSTRCYAATNPHILHLPAEARSVTPGIRGQVGCALYAPGQGLSEHVSAAQARTQQPSPEP